MSYKDPQVHEYIPADQIDRRLNELARDITADYHRDNIENNQAPLVILCVLGGAFMFCADLIRKLKLPLKVDFIKLSSYGHSTESLGKVKVELMPKYAFEGTKILIVEDIVDTGTTINFLHSFIKKNTKGKIGKIHTAAFLCKEEKAMPQVDIDYVAFSVKDDFLVGYGLDFAGYFRELPYLAVYREE